VGIFRVDLKDASEVDDRFLLSPDHLCTQSESAPESARARKSESENERARERRGGEEGKGDLKGLGAFVNTW
jgi:hypothetical protein